MLFRSVWLISAIATQRVYNLCFTECLSAIDVLTRYVLAIPAAILAAWAMISRRPVEAIGGR